MARGPANFRQRDLTAALKGVRAAGCSITQVRWVTKGGEIVVDIGEPEVAPPASNENEWDE